MPHVGIFQTYVNCAPHSTQGSRCPPCTWPTSGCIAAQGAGGQGAGGGGGLAPRQRGARGRAEVPMQQEAQQAAGRGERVAVQGVRWLLALGGTGGTPSQVSTQSGAGRGDGGSLGAGPFSVGRVHRPWGSWDPARFSEAERRRLIRFHLGRVPRGTVAPRALAGIQALCLFLHRVHTEAGPCLNSTQRCPQSGRALHPKQGQPWAPGAWPGSAQNAGQAGSRGAGGPCPHLLSRSTGGGARGPAVDTGGKWEPRWPCLGHRWGVGTQVAPSWTQAGGWVHAALLWRAHRLPCLGHRPGVGG